jgi:formate--tetrahydrofolate ligase
MPNLERHVTSLQSFGIPVVISVNAFSSDTEAEKQVLLDHCKKLNVPAALSYGWAEGGKGCTDLADLVINAADSCTTKFVPTYQLNEPIRTKMEKICRTIYGATNVILTNVANNQMRRFERMGYGELPVCIAKTQKSLSDDEKRLGRPKNFDINIREFEIATGAGFIIPIAGNILRMPGLPATPSSENITMDKNGTISGLF